jgi:replicative DNA helicase
MWKRNTFETKPPNTFGTLYFNVFNVKWYYRSPKIFYGGIILKTNPSTSIHQQHNTKSQLTKTIVTPEIFVHCGIQELDKLLDGFKAGEIVYIDGRSDLISEIPNQLCVHTYRTFNSDTIYIDGGICMDPYKIAKYARIMEIDQYEVLNHVQISRAFTIYQLSTFIEQMLEKEIKKHQPRTLIIGRFPTLYLDPDVPKKESQCILKNNIQTLKKLTEKYHLITILTNIDSRLYSNPTRKTIQEYSHETIQMRYIEPCTYVDLLKKQRSTTIFTMADGQLRLDHFGLVI